MAEMSVYFEVFLFENTACKSIWVGIFREWKKQMEQNKIPPALNIAAHKLNSYCCNSVSFFFFNK